MTPNFAEYYHAVINWERRLARSPQITQIPQIHQTA
jgi:hypothetical protein